MSIVGKFIRHMKPSMDWVGYFTQDPYRLKRFPSDILSDAEYQQLVERMLVAQVHIAVDANKQPSDEFLKLAIEKRPISIHFVQHQTPELCRYAVRLDPFAMRYVLDPGIDICQSAIRGMHARLHETQRSGSLDHQFELLEQYCKALKQFPAPDIRLMDPTHGQLPFWTQALEACPTQIIYGEDTFLSLARDLPMVPVIIEQVREGMSAHEALTHSMKQEAQEYWLQRLGAALSRIAPEESMVRDLVSDIHAQLNPDAMPAKASTDTAPGM